MNKLKINNCIVEENDSYYQRGYVLTLILESLFYKIKISYL